jgi:fibronectin type 3 domain-containing protein
VHLENNKEAESDLSSEVSITPVDKFAPATPAGVHADSAPATIELAWERNAEPDLAGYRVYRATAGGSFDKVAEIAAIPTWSDHAVESGKTYRYVLTAFDRAGNESPRSAPVEVTFP